MNGSIRLESFVSSVIRFAFAAVFVTCAIGTPPARAQQTGEAFYQQSNSLRTAGKLPEALAAMDRAIALSPANSEYFRARGALKLTLKDYDGVVADARKAIEIQPGNARAWNLLGSVKHQQKDYPGAIAEYEKAIIIDPNYAAATVNKGVALIALERIDEAEPILLSVLAKTSNNALVNNRLGFIAARRKEFRKAIDYFTRAIELDDKDFQSWNSRGVAHVEMKEFSAARSDFQNSLRVRPGFEMAQKNLDKVPAIEARNAGVAPAAVPPSSRQPEQTKSTAAPPPATEPAATAPAAPTTTAATRRARAGALAPLPKVAPPAKIEFANLPGSIYESAVSAGMEGMKLVLTPATEAENTQIERLWAPAFQFPCAEVVDYLNRLNPLLAEFLAYRSSAAYTEAEFSRANTDALEMAALGNDDAVDAAMAEAQAQAQRLTELGALLEKTSAAIRALGDPPDASALMGRARRRAQQAYQYGSSAPEGDLEYLHRTNYFRITANGSIGFIDRKGEAGNVDVPIPQIATYGFPVQWNGDEFFYSGPTFIFDQKERRDSNLRPGSHLVLGKISPDGDRLLSLRFLTRRDDGAEYAIELRDVDLRNREQSASPYISFLSNYSLTPSYATASQVFKSTVRLLGQDLVKIVEYRPFGFSVSLFKDPDVPLTFGSKEALATVRTRLGTFWKRPTGWARVVALSDEKFAALFHKGSTAAPKPAPVKVVAKTKAQEEDEDKKARMEALQKDIEYIQADLTHLRNLKAGDPGYIQFLLDAKESEVLSKRDLIASLQTGECVHTRTPFDDRTRAQLIAYCENEVQQLASMDRERRTADMLKAKLDPIQRELMQKQVQTLLKSGAATDPAKWREINASAYTKYQARLGQEKEAADDQTAVWDNRIFYAEVVRGGADTAFSLLAGGGGYKVAEFVYFLGTGGLEGGLGKYYQTGSVAAAVKRGLWDGGTSAVTRINDKAHYAWVAGEAYFANEKATPSERMASAAAAVAGKYATAKVMGVVMKQAASFLGQAKGRQSWKPGGAEAIAAMKHRQQMELDNALVKDFVATDRLYRRALATRAPAADLAKLRLDVERKVFSVNSSYGAKLIMKHQTLPADQKNYTRILREVHDELTPQLVSTLRAGRLVAGKSVGRYDGNIRMVPIRNASSGDTPGVDYDLALVEHANLRRGPGGKLVPNVWLTCDGVPASAHALREDAQKAFNALYRKRTGYSAKVSLENVTISTHPEAYADRAWLNVKDGRFTKPPDPAWAQQAADVTRYKANEMQHDAKLLLGYYAGKQEACRGTAKDIQTKLRTVLSTVESQQGAKWTPAQKLKHAEVTTFWTEVETVMRGFGQGRMDPLEAERRIHLLSGGRGMKDLVDRAGTTMEGYAKALPRP